MIWSQNNNMKNVIILKGFIGSGKTTYALRLMEEHKNKYKRVNKDELRAMVDNGVWSKDNEKLILKIRDSIIRESLEKGYSVIVDDTNLEDIHEKQIRLVANDFFANVEITFIDTPIEECIRRDSLRAKPVGEIVIRSMADRYFKKTNNNDYKNSFDANLPNVAIFDLDGTLAKIGNRSPYDAKNVHVDTLNEYVYKILKLVHYNDPDTKVFIFSGRDGLYIQETREWLNNNKVPYEKLVMRSIGDKRKDTIVKREFFDEHIKGKYNVSFVVDDRPSVCRMWRELGLEVLQVGDPYKEF